MTGDAWESCTDPHALLGFLQDRASDRKVRLFLCACCRRVWRLLALSGRAAVTVAEDYADGLATDGELEVAYERTFQEQATAFDAWDAGGYRAGAASLYYSACLAYSVTLSVVSAAAALNGVMAVTAEAAPPDSAFSDYPAPAFAFSDYPASAPEAAAQCHLLRDLFAPFDPLRIEPAWLAGCDGAVPVLARGIYEERAFERMPILADALEEAGCDHAGLLAHCRAGEGHVRGCWAVDAILGRE